MPTLTVKTQISVDYAAVAKSVGVARRRALKRIGYEVRQQAVGILKEGDDSAKPGEAPKLHPKSRLPKGTLYQYDQSTESVVIGPRVYAAAKSKTYPVPMPQLVQAGGTIRLPERKGTTVFKGKRRRVMLKAKTVTYAEHPLMVPALEKAMPGIPAKLKDII